MLKQYNKGFSFIEVLVAKTILLFILVIFIPIFTTISYEQAVLKSRLVIVSSLHDQLLSVVLSDKPITSIVDDINNEQVEFTFKLEQRYIKGCAKWKNQQDRKEEVCLYGLDKE